MAWIRPVVAERCNTAMACAPASAAVTYTFLPSGVTTMLAGSPSPRGAASATHPFVAAVAGLARQSSWTVGVTGSSSIGVSAPVVGLRRRTDTLSETWLVTYANRPSGVIVRAFGCCSTRAPTQPPAPAAPGVPSPTQPSSPGVAGSSGTERSWPVAASRCIAATVFEVPAV